MVTNYVTRIKEVVNMILLTKDCKTREMYIAAAYLVASGIDDAKDVVKFCTPQQRTNVYSDEVKNTITSKFSGAFSNLIALHIKCNVCDPIIESASTPIDAITQIAAVLKKDYVPVS